jgi:hypothetical protein
MLLNKTNNLTTTKKRRTTCNKNQRSTNNIIKGTEHNTSKEQLIITKLTDPKDVK